MALRAIRLYIYLFDEVKDGSYHALEGSWWLLCLLWDGIS